VELEEGGYVKVHDHCKTSVEGVFSAGDLHDTGEALCLPAAGLPRFWWPPLLPDCCCSGWALSLPPVAVSRHWPTNMPLLCRPCSAAPQSGGRR
jgi:hypothetical protein